MSNYLKKHIILEKIKNPTKTNIMPNKLLIIMLEKAAKYSLFLNNFTVSNEKVEKVVNAPKNPVIKNNFKLLDNNKLSTTAHNIPMQKHPIKFTQIVLNGNEVGENFTISSERLNLASAPKAPPNATAKKHIIGCSLFLQCYSYKTSTEHRS